MLNSILKSTIVFLISVVLISGCGKKDDKQGDNQNKKNPETSESLKLKPKTGEKNNYEMIINQKKVLTQVDDKKNPSMSQDYFLNFYYTQEVGDVSESGYITYKIKFDSIRANIKLIHPDSTLEVKFNWPNVDPLITSKDIKNIRDSVMNSDDMLVYRSLIGKSIKARMSPLGEVSTIYEIEPIVDYVFDAAVEKVKDDQRDGIKKGIEEIIKELVQQQFQKFPAEEVKKDSSWIVNKETVLDVVFPYTNILKYTIKSYESTNDGTIVTITFSPSYKLTESTYKEKGTTVELKDMNLTGGGEIKFNITKGVLVKKDSQVNLSRVIVQSAGGRSGKLKNEDLMSIKINKL